MACAARLLVQSNGLSHIIEVIESKIEDIGEDRIAKGDIDVIVSEPLGTFLLNERMLETYVIARDKFLKSDGKMFPASAHLCIIPFYDEAIYQEQMNKTTFWDNQYFHGVNFTCLKEQAIAEKFS